MFDQHEPQSSLKKVPFSFVPNRYEIWEQGKMTSSGKTSNQINATVEDNLVKVTFQDNNLNNQLSKENDFELFRASTDRLQLVSIPKISNSSCVGLNVLRQFVGTTCEEKNFMYNEPYCCNLFTIDEKIAKITFSFSNPERLIEFYQ